MPQGCAKKIQLQTLLTQLALQFLDPMLGLPQIFNPRRWRHGTLPKPTAYIETRRA
jgi:hypothetical protein